MNNRTDFIARHTPATHTSPRTAHDRRRPDARHLIELALISNRAPLTT